MARKKTIDEPAVESMPDGHVRVELRDYNEDGVHYAFHVAAPERDRKYAYEGREYEASRQDADGTWIYRHAHR